MAAESSDSARQMSSAYTEFKEFGRKQIQHYQKMFKHYDLNRDQYIDVEELRQLMEKLRFASSEQQLREMIDEVDEDGDGRLSFRDFLGMFMKGRHNQLASDGWIRVYRQIHVDTT